MEFHSFSDTLNRCCLKEFAPKEIFPLCDFVIYKYALEKKKAVSILLFGLSIFLASVKDWRFLLIFPLGISIMRGKINCRLA